MGVDVLVERIEFWIFALEGGLDRLLQGCDVELRMRWQRNHAAQSKCGDQGLCKLQSQTSPGFFTHPEYRKAQRMSPSGLLEPQGRRPANGRNRRILLVAAGSREGPLTEPTRSSSQPLAATNIEDAGPTPGFRSKSSRSTFTLLKSAQAFLYRELKGRSV